MAIDLDVLRQAVNALPGLLDEVEELQAALQLEREAVHVYCDAANAARAEVDRLRVIVLGRAAELPGSLELVRENERLRAELKTIADQGVLNSTTAENMRDGARAALTRKP